MNLAKKKKNNEFIIVCIYYYCMYIQFYLLLHNYSKMCLSNYFMYVKVFILLIEIFIYAKNSNQIFVIKIKDKISKYK